LKKIIVDVPGKSYPVFVGESILPRIKKEMHNLPDKKAVIIDRNVERLHGTRLKKIFSTLKGDIKYFQLRNGESAKSITELNRLYNFLLRENFGKDSILFAVGGGVTGDLTSFAASTFKRGIPVVHIPTTLLSAIDSSVGGKTAVNLGKIKNAVGTFHQPDYVFTDISFLDTLPVEEINSGIGELIKYTFLSDPNFFIYVLNNIKKIRSIDPRVLESVIFRSVSMKASIVSRDEKEESGLRKILNFGHTFGHAIESTLNYKIKHGEAVTAGIVASLHLSNKLGLLPENRLITYLKLPQRIKIPEMLRKINFDDLLEKMMGDKKNRGGKINFVLISEIGSLLIDVAAGNDDIRYAFDKLISSIKR
jgi:3-dehydroquinate synthase